MTRPLIFSDLRLVDALATSKAENKLLLVDATAAWCEPCKAMDRTTWSDPALAASLRDTAIVLQLDVDADPDAKLLSVRAMPTVVVFREGVEIDRVTGLQSTAQLTTWLEGLRAGETALVRMRRETRPDDVRARLKLAQMLFDHGDLDGALAEYLWLWENMLALVPGMIGVRHSFFLGYLGALMKVHEPAREAFERVRDAIRPPESGLPDDDRFADWLSLSLVLDARQDVVAWFDTWWPNANEFRNAPSEDVQRIRWLLEKSVAPLLAKAGRWSDIGMLFVNPLASLHDRATHLERLKGVPDTHGRRERLVQRGEDDLRKGAARIVRALRAAGRQDDEVRVADEARRLDPSDAMRDALAQLDAPEDDA